MIGRTCWVCGGIGKHLMLSAISCPFCLGRERRRHERLPWSRPAMAAYCGDTVPGLFPCSVENISAGGALVTFRGQSRQRSAEGREFLLRVPVSENGVALRAVCMVRRLSVSSDETDAAVEFGFLDEPSFLLLHSLAR
jgi:hypothetical protein